MILYTTDDTSLDGNWVSEIVEGELMSFTVGGLTPSTTYFFKIQAKNSIGYGPFSPTISIKTLPGIINLCGLNSILILYYTCNSLCNIYLRWSSLQ